MASVLPPRRRSRFGPVDFDLGSTTSDHCRTNNGCLSGHRAGKSSASRHCCQGYSLLTSSLAVGQDLQVTTMSGNARVGRFEAIRTQRFQKHIFLNDLKQLGSRCDLDLATCMHLAHALPHDSTVASVEQCRRKQIEAYISGHRWHLPAHTYHSSNSYYYVFLENSCHHPSLRKAPLHVGLKTLHVV